MALLDREAAKRMVKSYAGGMILAFVGARHPKPETQNRPSTLNPQPETRSPKPKARKPKNKTRNSKTETQNTKPETRNTKLETRNMKTETLDPKQAMNSHPKF